jgi:hypothetical protein
LLWFKPANPRDTAYRSGWPGGIKVDFLGSKFVLPAKPTSTNPNPPFILGTDNILGLRGAPPFAPVKLVLADGGTPGFSRNATVDARNKVAITDLPDALNLKAIFSTNPITHIPTGKLTGSFKHSGNNKTVSFAGLVFQKLNEARGYFLYFPPKPAGQPAPEALSGSVGIAP